MTKNHFRSHHSFYSFKTFCKNCQFWKHINPSKNEEKWTNGLTNHFYIRVNNLNVVQCVDLWIEINHASCKKISFLERWRHSTKWKYPVFHNEALSGMTRHKRWSCFSWYVHFNVVRCLGQRLPRVNVHARLTHK